MNPSSSTTSLDSLDMENFLDFENTDSSVNSMFASTPSSAAATPASRSNPLKREPSNTLSSNAPTPTSSSASQPARHVLQTQLSGLGGPSHPYDSFTQNTSPLMSNLYDNMGIGAGFVPPMQNQINPITMMNTSSIGMDLDELSMQPAFFFPESQRVGAGFVNPSMAFGSGRGFVGAGTSGVFGGAPSDGMGASKPMRGGPDFAFKEPPVLQTHTGGVEWYLEEDDHVPSLPSSASSSFSGPSPTSSTTARPQPQRTPQEQAARAMALRNMPPAQPVSSHGDPEIDERIRMLLESVKRGPNGSVALHPVGSNSLLPSFQKMKKDEEDMDEDERLLASEEGKKLTSKERRQLRNKVSARAFRSRRKEYITQLEGEVQARTNESNELRTRCNQLQDENARLQNTLRTLLQSPAMTGFLTALPLPSNDTAAENTSSNADSNNTTSSADNLIPNTRKDQAASSSNDNASSADWPLAYSAGMWSSGITNSPQVFAVTDISYNHIPSASDLSGKPEPSLYSSVQKQEIEMPYTSSYEPEEEDEDETEESTEEEETESVWDDLYGDRVVHFPSPTSVPSYATAQALSEAALLGRANEFELIPGVPLEKLLSRIELALVGSVDEEQPDDIYVERMEERIAGAYHRVGMMMSS